jgi:hypothetical protein
VVAVLLVLSAVALALNHFGDLNPVFLDPVARTLLGLAAGVGIGIVAPVRKDAEIMTSNARSRQAGATWT